MDIRCPSCSKLFRVADEKIAGKGIRFKCSKCAEVITVTKDDFEMDLLARDADVTAKPIPPAAQPAPPAQTAPAPEPEAREYKPPVDQPVDDQAIPPASLNDFDFSEPHAAATAAAHPAAGFGGADHSFDSVPEQDATPEIEISPEAAAEAEAALQFPDDLISEPKRKPVFGTASPHEQASGGDLDAADQEPDFGAALAMPKGPSAEVEPGGEDQELDLGAALAMPKGTATDAEQDRGDQESEHGAAPAASKGPVISPELLAQIKRAATDRSAVPAKTAHSADEDIDLGAALAMPKSTDTTGQEASPSGAMTAEMPQSGGSSAWGKGALVIGAIALALVAVLAALLYLGILGGKDQHEAQQKPQFKSQTTRQPITPEGLTIMDPVAFVDPERGDLVIKGRIQNTLDRPKAGWYLVAEVRDAKESVLTTVKMVNGVQQYSDKERELLAKRGAKAEEIQNMTRMREGTIPARGMVNFELRVMNPPAGSARVLPTLRPLEPAAQGTGKQ
jgi:predicted Zn finger-like uncharacterized protein